MHMRIDEAGKDIFTGGVDDFRARVLRQIVPDGRDRFVFTPDVGRVLIAGGDDRAVLD